MVSMRLQSILCTLLSHRLSFDVVPHRYQSSHSQEDQVDYTSSEGLTVSSRWFLRALRQVYRLILSISEHKSDTGEFNRMPTLDASSAVRLIHRLYFGV